LAEVISRSNLEVAEKRPTVNGFLGVAKKEMGVDCKGGHEKDTKGGLFKTF